MKGGGKIEHAVERQETAVTEGAKELKKLWEEVEQIKSDIAHILDALETLQMWVPMFSTNGFESSYSMRPEPHRTICTALAHTVVSQTQDIKTMNYNIGTILAVIAIIFVLITYITSAPLVPVAVILLGLAIIFGGRGSGSLRSS